MTLDANEFMRRFLTHVLPKGFRRIRHFGFLANSCCVQKLARIRAALDVPNPEPSVESKDYRDARLAQDSICVGCNEASGPVAEVVGMPEGSNRSRSAKGYRVG
jgi:hypothetical protein